MSNINTEDNIEAIKSHKDFNSLNDTYKERAMMPLYLKYLFDCAVLMKVDRNRILEIVKHQESLPDEIRIIYYDVLKENY